MNVKIGHSTIEAGRDVCSNNRIQEIHYHLTDSGTVTSQSWNRHLDRSQLKSCPSPSRCFTGRSNILERLQTYFFSKRKDHSRIFVLHGLGGTGKSQIARKFIHAYCTTEKEGGPSSSISNVLYIDATSDYTICAGFEALARAAGLQEDVESALNWLAALESENWLIYFDGADDPRLDLQLYFPATTKANILITTRNPHICTDYGINPSASCHVSKMTVDEGVRLFLVHSSLGESSYDDAMILVQELGCLALAISQAGSARLQMRISLREYIALYRKTRIGLFQNDGVGTKQLYGYSKTVYTTCFINFEQLSPNAATVFSLFAYLYHQGISEDLFRLSTQRILNFTPITPFSDSTASAMSALSDILRFFQASSDTAWNSRAFRTIINELYSFSLVDFDVTSDGDTSNSSLSVHPLVQELTRARLSETTGITAKHVELFLGMSVDGADRSSKGYACRRSLLPHVEGMLEETDLDYLETDDLMEFGIVLGDAGTRWGRVEELMREVLQRTQRLPPESMQRDKASLRAMESLGVALYRQDRADEAEVYEKKVLEIRLRTFGDDHPDTQRSKVNLAGTLRKLKKLSEAEKLERDAIQHRIRLFGNNCQDTLLAKGNLAVTLQKQGRWAEAKEIGEEVLRGYKKVCGEDHRETLKAMQNLAIVFEKEGRVEDATAISKQVLEKRRRVLGTGHPETLLTMQNLAGFLSRLGRSAEAEVISRELLQRSKASFGESHPRTFSAEFELALAILLQGRSYEAEMFLRDALQRAKEALGDDHEKTLLLLSNLAVSLHHQERWEEAVVLDKEILGKYSKVGEEGHKNVLEAMNNLAVSYRKTGQTLDARELEVSLHRHRYGKGLEVDTAESAALMSNIVGDFYQQGKGLDATAWQRHLVKCMQNLYGEGDTQTIQAINILSELEPEVWKVSQAAEAAVPLQPRHRTALSAVKSRREVYCTSAILVLSITTAVVIYRKYRRV